MREFKQWLKEHFLLYTLEVDTVNKFYYLSYYAKGWRYKTLTYANLKDKNFMDSLKEEMMFYKQ